MQESKIVPPCFKNGTNLETVACTQKSLRIYPSDVLSQPTLIKTKRSERKAYDPRPLSMRKTSLDDLEEFKKQLQELPTG